MSRGYSFRVLTICSGDQRATSFFVTYSRNGARPASIRLPSFLDEADARARLRAENARYPLLPLLRPTSRDTVPRSLPMRVAISTIPAPLANPLLISSRSRPESRLYFRFFIRSEHITPLHFRYIMPCRFLDVKSYMIRRIDM